MIFSPFSGSETQKYHLATYGASKKYFDFAADFAEQTKNFSAAEWASLFQAVGARCRFYASLPFCSRYSLSAAGTWC
jgi:hypothetical protein